MPARHHPRHAFGLEVGACLGLLATLKLALLVADGSMRLFMGDSASYFHAALTDWVPSDRSFVYPYLIRLTAIQAGSIHALLAVQTLFGVASGLLLFVALRRMAGIGFGLALAAAGLFAVEPAQLFYERMMMAESAGQLALALMIVGLLAYVRSGRVGWLAAAALAGVAAVAFRMSLLPTVLGLTAFAPFVRSLVHTPALDPGRPLLAFGRLFLHLGLAVLFTASLHGAYKDWYASLVDADRGYMADAGMMRLGLIAPLVRPHHLERVGLDPRILDEVEIAIDDHRAREAHIWSERGLYAAIRRHSADPSAAARKISSRAVQDDPLGLLRLGVLTLADYFDPAVFRPRLQDDIGRRDLSENLLQRLREVARYDATGVPASDSLVSRYFGHAWPWLTACLFLAVPLSLAVLLVGWKRMPDRRDVLLMLVLASCGLVASQVLFSHIVSFRYLHPLPWLVLAHAALLVRLLGSRRTAKP